MWKEKEKKKDFLDIFFKFYFWAVGGRKFRNVPAQVFAALGRFFFFSFFFWVPFPSHFFYRARKEKVKEKEKKIIKIP